MKKILVSILLIAMAVCFVACEVEIPGVGTGTISASALETPNINKIENNVVYWEGVTNASKYAVSVNGIETEVSALNFSLSSVLTETCEVSIKVRAKGDGLMYTDSAWSEEKTGVFMYMPQFEAGEVIDDCGLGTAVDIVTARSYDDLKTGVNVFSPEKLQSMNILKANKIGFDEDYYFSSSIRDIVFNSSLSFSVQNSAFGEIKGISVGATQGFEAGGSIRYTDYKSRCFMIEDCVVEGYRLSIEGYRESSTFADSYSSDYLEALEKLKNGGSYEEFFGKYGTHIVASAIYGGRLNAYYSFVTNKRGLDLEAKASINQSVSAGFKGKVGGGRSVEAEIAAALGISTSEMQTSFHTEAFGGQPFVSEGIEDFREKLNEWCKSFTNADMCTLIDYDDDGLVALWSILPEEYSALAEPMEAAFYAYYNDYQSSVFSKFMSGDFAGGDGSASNPYMIEDATQLAKIGTVDMSAHYILISDIDLSQNDWSPIGGAYKQSLFTGTLSGKIDDKTNYKIMNLHFKGSVAEKNHRSYFGLFGAIGSGGLVTNIDFTDVNILQNGPDKKDKDMRCFIGTVAGYCEGKIANVNIDGYVAYSQCTNGESYVGGAVGLLYGGELTSVVNSADIRSYRYTGIAGGLVGYVNHGSISRSENKGRVSSKCTQYGGWAISGGIVGSWRKDGEFTYTETKNSGIVETLTYAGLGKYDHRKGDIYGCKVNRNMK